MIFAICKRLIFYLVSLAKQPGPKVINHFSCTTQLNMKCQLLMKNKMLRKKVFFTFKLSDVEGKKKKKVSVRIFAIDQCVSTVITIY